MTVPSLSQTVKSSAPPWLPVRNVYETPYFMGIIEIPVAPAVLPVELKHRLMPVLEVGAGQEHLPDLVPDRVRELLSVGSRLGRVLWLESA